MIWVIQYIMSVFWTFSNSNGFLNDKDVLSVICEKKASVSSENLKLNVTYLNVGSDTIVIPIKYLQYSNFQTIKFHTKENIWCTKMTKMFFSNNVSITCNYDILEENGFCVLPPNEGISVEYELRDLGCINYNFSRGEVVHYSVSLDIDERFKNWCDKIWVGQTASDIGSFIIN